jgi:glycosyltransferase involved in cell wall biosynthesis
MRILLVSEPGVDGVFRHVEALAGFLRGAGHEIHLAYSDARGSERLTHFVAEIASNGGRVLNLGISNAPGPRDIGALMRLRSFASSLRPDVIHAHSSKAGALVRALPFLGIRAPVFYTPHAYFGLAGGHGMKACIFNTIESLLGRIGTSFVLSRGEQEFAQQTLHIPAARLRLNPNPVDTQRFHPASAEEKAALRTRLGLPENAKLLGTVGRLAFQKDPITLYHAFTLALKQTPDLWLHHLGDGELSDECAALATKLGISHRIIREPYLSEPLRFYQALDGLILTSRYEGLSLAVLEALACDLPVILTEAPGNTDFLTLGLSHLWSSPKENPGAIATAIGKWAADLAHHRSSNHRQTAEQRFSQGVCYGLILAEYFITSSPSCSPSRLASAQCLRDVAG